MRRYCQLAGGGGILHIVTIGCTVVQNKLHITHHVWIKKDHTMYFFLYLK